MEELIRKNILICERIESKAKMFSNSMMVLSILDVVFGVLAIFCTSLQVVAIYASASSLTAITIFGRVIQVSKIRQLEKGLKTCNIVSLTWFAKKFEKEIKMKQTKSTKLQKILTSVLAVFGVGGIVMQFFPQFTSISQSVTNIISMISESIAVVSGIWLSQTSDKVLTEEEKAKITEAENEKKKKDAQALLDKIHEAQKLVNGR